jgi:hypothetical protein
MPWRAAANHNAVPHLANGKKDMDEVSPKITKPIARRLVIRYHPTIDHVVEAFVRCSNPPAEMVMDQSLPDGKMILEFHIVDGTVIVWGSTEGFVY